MTFSKIVLVLCISSSLSAMDTKNPLICPESLSDYSDNTLDHPLTYEELLLKEEKACRFGRGQLQKNTSFIIFNRSLFHAGKELPKNIIHRSLKK